MDALDMVRFEDALYTLIGDQDNVRCWQTPEGDGVSLYHFSIPPDIPASLSDSAAIRRAYSANVYGAGLGVIEIDVIDVSMSPAIRTIVKVPQQPSGMTYLGSITIPFRSSSYVLKCQCPEQGTTGVRDAMVLNSALQDGLVKVDDSGVISGWTADPFDLTIKARLMRNLSESEAYDGEFPDHPLSRLRRNLRHIQATTQLSRELHEAAAYEHQSTVQKAKPWWKRW